MKTKLKLDQLNISSFVTAIDKNEKLTINGGRVTEVGQAIAHGNSSTPCVDVPCTCGCCCKH